MNPKLVFKNLKNYQKWSKISRKLNMSQSYECDSYKETLLLPNNFGPIYTKLTRKTQTTQLLGTKALLAVLEHCTNTPATATHTDLNFPRECTWPLHSQSSLTDS